MTAKLFIRRVLWLTFSPITLGLNLILATGHWLMEDDLTYKEAWECEMMDSPWGKWPRQGVKS